MNDYKTKLEDVLKELEHQYDGSPDYECSKNYMEMKLLHCGMQSKLYNIMLTWDFGKTALEKNQISDIQESLKDDKRFLTNSFHAWDAIESSQSNELIKECATIYLTWIHDIQNLIIWSLFFEDVRKDKEVLLRSIVEYRNDLQLIFLVS